jgi:uncharacterized protein
MAISMYQASVPVFISSLKSLSSILHKAVAHAEKQGFDPNVLTASRLYPDMFPLTRQVQVASDTAKGAGARLAGMDPPKFEDTETTFPELIERINKTIAFLRTLKAAQIDGSEDREIVLKFPSEKLEFNGQDYLLGYALPNFFFHVTTAYAILRHNGVAIGKRDYLGEPPARTGKSSTKKKAA